MYSLMLSNWNTLRAPSATPPTTIKQPESQWLDVGDYEDLIGWLEVKEFTNSGGTLTWAYQFSPTKDDGNFVASSASTVTVSATGVTVTKLLSMSGGAAPVYNARWLRYQVSISSSLAWDLTFRCWMSANVGARVKRHRERCACGRVLILSLGRCGCGRLLRSAQ